MKVRWTKLAIRDLAHAHDFIQEENPAAAEAAIDRIQKSEAMLERHPRIGRPGRVPGTRELIVSALPFILAYRENAGAVEVLAVIHASRQWPEAL